MKTAKKNPSLGIYNAIEEAHKSEAKKMSRAQLKQEIEKMQSLDRVNPTDSSNKVRLCIFNRVYERHPGTWPIRVPTTS